MELNEQYEELLNAVKNNKIDDDKFVWKFCNLY